MARPNSIDEILAKGSKALRAANARAEGKVYASRTASNKGDDAPHLVTFTPDPGPQYSNQDGAVGKSCPTCGSPQGPLRIPRVTFTLFRVQLLDLESRFASVKYLLDGLRYADLIADDREGDAELFVNQTRVRHYLEEGTAITIEYP